MTERNAAPLHAREERRNHHHHHHHHRSLKSLEAAPDPAEQKAALNTAHGLEQQPNNSAEHSNCAQQLRPATATATAAHAAANGRSELPSGPRTNVR